MTNALVPIALITGLALVILIMDGGEIHSLRSRVTTSLRTDDSVVSIVKSTSKRTKSTVHQSDTFCSLVQDSLSSKSPSQWWTNHFADILEASLQHPKDPNQVYRNWTLAILASLSPDMLQQGVRSRPSSHSLDRLTSRIHKRITDPDNVPPVKIVVVGGSVTRGQRCYEPILNGTKRMDPTLCAWPSRIERLINTLAGIELIQVYNLAVSATGLSYGTPLIKYWLFPQELLPDGPDVIVASYSTNEQNFAHNAYAKFIDHERGLLQKFISASQSTRPCDPPLVVFVDDYLGNKHDFILDEMAFNKVSTDVADWYAHVMHVSYADVVRRVLYADTEETTFTQWPLDSSGEQKQEVHFGMGGHVAISWSVLYALINVFSAYCDNQVFEERMQREGYKAVIPKSVMDMVNAVPPPRLTWDLSLGNVSRLWQDNVVRMRETQSGCSNKTAVSKSPCEFAFLFGPAFTIQDPEMYSNFMQPFLVSTDGWEAIMEYGRGGNVKKPGLLATRANATMTFKLTNIQRVVRVITVQRIKSYGDKWAGSKARFTILIESPDKDEFRTHFDVVGHHEVENSVSFPHEYDLKGNKAVEGSNVTVTVDLVGGSVFKILGLTLCSS